MKVLGVLGLPAREKPGDLLLEAESKRKRKRKEKRKRMVGSARHNAR